MDKYLFIGVFCGRYLAIPLCIFFDFAKLRVIIFLENKLLHKVLKADTEFHKGLNTNHPTQMYFCDTSTFRL